MGPVPRSLCGKNRVDKPLKYHSINKFTNDQPLTMIPNLTPFLYTIVNRKFNILDDIIFGTFITIK